MPCGEILGLLFCLTCFIREEEVCPGGSYSKSWWFRCFFELHLLRTNKTRKAKKKAKKFSARHVSLRDRRERTSPWVPFGGVGLQSWTLWGWTEEIPENNGRSSVIFIIWMNVSAQHHWMKFQERRLGFPKRAYFWKFIMMATLGEWSKDGLTKIGSLRGKIQMEDTKKFTLR